MPTPPVLPLLPVEDDSVDAMRDAALLSIPVIVLTASDESTDVPESFTYRIGGCLVRPYDCAGFRATVITSAGTAITDPLSNKPETTVAA